MDKLGNIWGARPVLCKPFSALFSGMTSYNQSLSDVNTEIDQLKQAVVKLIKAGQPVFFGCDVGQFSDRDAGIMDPAIFEYEVSCLGIQTLALMWGSRTRF